MPELIDIYDANMNHIGSAERIAAHRAGLWHRTFHCWVIGEDHMGPFVLLQLRSETKKNYPNMLDITAAGHLEAGETPQQGVRELEEELGITVSLEKLTHLGIKHDVMDEIDVRNREFADVYLYRDDRAIDQYDLQKAEVSGLVRMAVSDGLSLFSGERGSVTCLALRERESEKELFNRDVRAQDLIPRIDNYYLKVFVMAQQLLAGHRYLTI